MSDHNRFPPELAGRRDQILAAVITNGRRRRRRRLAWLVTAVAAPVALIAAVILYSIGHTHQTQVNVIAPSELGACQGGATATGTAARQDVRIAFGWLPPGFKTVPSTAGQAPGYFSVSATRTGRQVNGRPTIWVYFQITSTPLSTLFAPSGQRPGGRYPAVSVAGHPGQFFLPAAGELSDPTVTWEPFPDMVLTVDNGAGISESELLRVADRLHVEPGVALPSVGDLGPVISRSAAITVAEGGPTSGATPATARVLGRTVAETWLVTPQQLTAAHIFATSDGAANQAGGLSSPWGADLPTTPLWVVAILVDTTHWNLVVIDAVNGQEIDGTTSGLHGLPLPASVTSLPDHAAGRPCAYPSPHPASVPSAHYPPECAVSQLSARYVGQRISNGTTTQLLIALRNTGPQACGLQGTPFQGFIKGITASSGIAVTGGEGIPLPFDFADPLVTLQPHTPTPPTIVTDPGQLPHGSAWIALTDGATQANTKRCPVTPVTGIALTLPFDATMPEITNDIPAVTITNPPVTVDDCGMMFTAGTFQAP
jgi:hypothetical protein